MAGDSAAPASASGFAVVRRGYDQAQVEAHLRRVDAELRMIATDRDAAVDQAAQLARELDDARARAERLRAQVRTLVSPPQNVQGMSDRMRSMLRLAEDEVAEMLAKAQAEAEARVQESDAQAEQTLAAARAEAEEAIAAARAEAAAIVAGARAATGGATEELARVRAEVDAERRAAAADIVAERTAAEQRLAAAEADAEQRRATIEEDFAIAMDQRRTAALAELAAEQTRARQEIEEGRAAAAAKARDPVATAKGEAAEVVQDAQRRVQELTALRAHIAEQLAGTRVALDRVLGDLGPLPVEQQEPPANGHRTGASTGPSDAGAPGGSTAGAPATQEPQGRPDRGGDREAPSDGPGRSRPSPQRRGAARAR